MDWLQDTFLELGNDSTEVERIRYARANILEMIGGYLMPDLSQNILEKDRLGKESGSAVLFWSPNSLLLSSKFLKEVTEN
ncbi:hypothetical protein PVK06_029877 [Gossypium arboreum]|uniref:Uncharacterized protein n=1 Tax=Gossypium arboreum TaxID=29729 RepID=A0ABR0NLS1_GOSAR|nr:hypothetical protein PVK06_029877 [Gossypium arboreum]